MDTVISASFSFVSAATNQGGLRERGLTSSQCECEVETQNEGESISEQRKQNRSVTEVAM